MEEILLKVKNNQKSTAKVFWILTLVFLIVMMLPFFENNPLSDIWALAFTGFFLCLSFFITALVFRNRAKKLDRLKGGSELLLSWELDSESHLKFAEYHRAKNKKKNKAIITVTTILFVVIGVPFLFILEEEELVIFLSIYLGVLLIVFGASLFFPWYYYRQNLKGDRQILVGMKYAYINGFFHNWDYPLSGLTKAKVIKKPFYGLQLAYYYTDRTLTNSEEIYIPAPDNIDLEKLSQQLLEGNKKRKGRK